jgi:hypothetical protein
MSLCLTLLTISVAKWAIKCDCWLADHFIKGPLIDFWVHTNIVFCKQLYIIQNISLSSGFRVTKAQEIDSSHLKTLILDVCKHVTALIGNNGVSVNFNQECVNIILAIMSVLLH